MRSYLPFQNAQTFFDRSVFSLFLNPVLLFIIYSYGTMNLKAYKIMRRVFFLSLLGALLFSGCTNTGAFLAANQTIVNLNEDNFSIAATNVTGESQAGYLLGVSYSNGLAAGSLAIARVDGTGMLYAEALENLWQNYESEHGEVENGQLALVNVRYDTDILNLVLYSQIKITVRADVVEFR